MSFVRRTIGGILSIAFFPVMVVASAVCLLLIGIEITVRVMLLDQPMKFVDVVIDRRIEAYFYPMEVVSLAIRKFSFP